VYCEEIADEVRDQLLAVNGVLVWVDPLSDGRPRFKLDAMLRDIAARGVWVSTHPEVTQKMGVKEVLHTTRHLGWGTDTHLYRTAAAFQDEFPSRLRSGGPRVLKQNRGNGGQGVWKIEPASAPDRGLVSVLEARRGSMPKTMPLSAFMVDCAAYFADGGCIVDQPFQPRLPDGMIRCYIGTDKVVGFGHQLIKALIPPPPSGPGSPEAQPGPRIMYPATTPQFQALRLKMETEWVPQLMKLFGLTREVLPIIWDADLLYGPRTAAGDDTYVLCEINVSSVMPIPDQAPAAIASLAKERLAASRTK
ncbi:MAG TPA: Cj0069 family protein, partial [Acetobacteraceae bacterium]|nr:Cj0069 family protein [Acetobacteraceae bacterium]